jgi:hypothetical protein
MYEKNINNKFQKLFYVELIITYFAKLIGTIYWDDYYKSFKKNKKIYSVKINESNLIKEIYEHLINDLLFYRLTYEKIINVCKNFIHFVINKKNRHSQRYSLIPFTKWYVKGYHELYKYKKINEAINNNNLNSLNKNLKTLSKDLNIVITIDNT